MKTKPRHLIALLLSALLLASAGSAMAFSITVDSFTLWSQINTGSGPGGQPGDLDDIFIVNGGTLVVDLPLPSAPNVYATCRNLTVGDLASYGSLQFPADTTQRYLTNNGAVSWGGSVPGNHFDMLGTAAHSSTLVVLGSVGLVNGASGSGVFTAGAGLVQYAGGNQTVAGLNNYKDVELAGSGVKTVNPGVQINGVLTISGTATVTGSSIAYGSLASLVYAGGAAQTTTSLEFPSGMAKAVAISNPSGVTLDGSKTLGGALTVNNLLKMGSFDLTLTAPNVFNNGSIQGVGSVILAGSATQSLNGGGHYGNLVLNNNATNTGTALNPIVPLLVDGKLTINSGAKLYLNGIATSGSLANSAKWLAFGSPLAHKAAGTWGDTVSGAANKDDTFFGGTGLINVQQDVTATFSSISDLTIPYSQTVISLSGVVSGDMGIYGKVYPASGETVSAVINGTTYTTQTTGGNGAFSFANIALVGTGINPLGYPITYKYGGGNNLAAAIDDSTTKLFVTAIPITVVPISTNKVYNGQGGADPALSFTVIGSLVGADGFAGSLQRVTGQDVGAYSITRSNIGLTAGLYITNSAGQSAAANYNVTVVDGATLTITKKLLSVIPDAGQNKFYNGTGLGANDPLLTFSVISNGVSVAFADANTVPFDGDSFLGALSRQSAGTAAGNLIGSYNITPGDLRLSAHAGNYNLQVSTGVPFTINPLQVAITPDENQFKYFGQTNGITGTPSGGLDYYTYTYSTKTNGVTFDPATLGDAFAGKLTRPAGETVGNYAITIGNLNITNAANAGIKTYDFRQNYAVSFTSKNYAITQAVVEVTAVATPSMIYAAALPALVSYNSQTKVWNTNNVLPSGKAQVTWTGPAWVSNAPGGVPNKYQYTVINGSASDSSYTFIYTVLPQNGELTVNPKALTITADNKTKPADGLAFTGFTATYSGFATGDTIANSLYGTLGFTGTAVTATLPGTYYHLIFPVGHTSYSNSVAAKYSITYAPGTLALTAPIATNVLTGNQTWPGSGTVIPFEIDKADGTSGINWTLIHINGGLTISGAGTEVDVTTLLQGTTTAGLMSHFDPTRPWSWKFVETTGTITGTPTGNFTVNTSGVGLFANPIFSGTFSITESADTTALFVTYTPRTWGTTTAASDKVGPITDTTTLLGWANAVSDLPALYLDVVNGSSVFYPTQTVTVNLNVANLGTNAVVGAQAFMNYSSSEFDVSLTQVAPGDATVWSQIISTNFYVTQNNGNLDAVVGVKLSNVGGTSANGTVAKITLVPLRSSTANTRFTFRGDAADNADYNFINALTDVNGGRIRPVRVLSEVIQVKNDATGPVFGTVNMTEMQPHLGTPPADGSVNVKSGAADAVRGTVLITVSVSDAADGTGLGGAPTVHLANGTATADLITTNVVTGLPGTTSTFNYLWTVDGSIAGGKYNATIIAKDKKNNSTTLSGSPYINVNVYEIDGVVELDSFAGTNRQVTFKAGPQGGAYMTKTLNLNFISSTFLPGAFKNRKAFVQEVVLPTQTVSSFLRYGDINNLQGFYVQLMNASQLSTDLRAMLFGDISTTTSGTPPMSPLDAVASALSSPVRAVDFYVSSRLTTAVAPLATYATYLVAGTARPANVVSAFKTALLNDFARIINGALIFDPIVFQGIGISTADMNLINNQNTSPLSALQIANLNRDLLQDAYAQFVPSTLNPQTSGALLNYAGGSNPALKALLLGDLDTITQTQTSGTALYSAARFFGVPLRTTTQTQLGKLLNPPTPPLSASDIVQLNRMLLEDFFASSGSLNFVGAPISVATLVALNAYLPNADGYTNDITTPVPAQVVAYTAYTNLVTWAETNLIADMNTLINGQLIYTADRFAAFVGGFPSDMLSQLSSPPALGTPALVRLNRRLLEAAFTLPSGDMLISGSVLCPYRFTDLPNNTTFIGVKAAWNLRKVLPVGNFGPGVGQVTFVVVNFVNDGAPGWSAGKDAYLRGGDLDGSNSVNLVDYGLLKTLYGQSGSTGAASDLNGDGVVFSTDYDLLKSNWLQSGDADF